MIRLIFVDGVVDIKIWRFLHRKIRYQYIYLNKIMCLPWAGRKFVEISGLEPELREPKSLVLAITPYLSNRISIIH